ncbi:type VII secretion target [Nocardia vinacea]|uniref:type VII secretion target n=1 Tax=Nocardia vinacea TaxID=96468 RepID=UPI00340E39D6
MSEVSVEPEKLRTHAANVEKVGQSLSQALEAAQAVSLPTDAFGKLCAFLPPTIRRAPRAGGWCSEGDGCWLAVSGAAAASRTIGM